MAFDADYAQLHHLIDTSRSLLVLTGAGCSTGSGIPDYRDAQGNWKHAKPVMYQDFLKLHTVRQRYWARSVIGWRHFAAALPNAAHRALASLEAAGHLRQLVTQNVDGLHARAGSRRVIDLHGRLDSVICTGCGQSRDRADLQKELEDNNPEWAALDAAPAPDGDAQLEMDSATFTVPECQTCDGILKPDVVFFGESIPRARVTQASDALAQADALLVAGSSLMVWSGLRLVRSAAQRNIPRALINLGRTRGDELFTCRVNRDCGATLSGVAQLLGCNQSPA